MQRIKEKALCIETKSFVANVAGTAHRVANGRVPIPKGNTMGWRRSIAILVRTAKKDKKNKTHLAYAGWEIEKGGI